MPQIEKYTVVVSVETTVTTLDGRIVEEYTASQEANASSYGGRSITEAVATLAGIVTVRAMKHAHVTLDAETERLQ